MIPAIPLPFWNNADGYDNDDDDDWTDVDGYDGEFFSYAFLFIWFSSTLYCFHVLIGLGLVQ